MNIDFIAIERMRLVESMEGDDLTAELYECGDVLLSAVKTGDERLIGRMVLAVYGAYLDRCAAIAAGFEVKAVYADEAAVGVLMASNEQRLAA